jgi:hypothetical protein
MPPLPNAPNIVKVRLVGTNQTTIWNNILHLQYTGPAPSVADCQTVADAVMSAWGASIKALVNVNADLERVDIVDLTSATTSEGSSSLVPIIGTRVGTDLAAQVAGVVSWSANLRYRGGHPRNYMPIGVTADVVGGKSWITAFQTEALAGARAFRTALNAVVHGTTTYKLVMLSYRTAHALRPTPLPITIQDAKFHGRLDTQRKRLGKETA